MYLSDSREYCAKKIMLYLNSRKNGKIKTKKPKICVCVKK